MFGAEEAVVGVFPPVFGTDDCAQLTANEAINARVMMNRILLNIQFLPKEYAGPVNG